MALHEAVKAGDLAEVMKLVQQEGYGNTTNNPKALVHSADESGFTPLHWACYYGHADIAALLLDHQALIDQPTRYSTSTPLRIACSQGQAKVVELLLKRRADPGLRNRDGWSCLMTACLSGHLDVVHCLLRYRGPGGSGGGIDLDARSKTGATALYQACFHGHDAVVRLLLEAGADPTIPRSSSKDDTPYHVALEEGHDACARLLEEWERCYTLTKARCLYDTSCLLNNFPCHPFNDQLSSRLGATPVYLKRRVYWRRPLPQVEVRGEEEKEEEGDGCDDAGLAAVTEYALHEMKAELFKELMMMME